MIWSSTTLTTFFDSNSLGIWASSSSTLLKGIIESLQKGCAVAHCRLDPETIVLAYGSAISSIETTLHHLILATLRHPQLTTRLTLQLRQNVFLRVPINVVGTGTSIPGCVRTEATSTPAREVTPPRSPPPPLPLSVPAPGPAGWKAIKAVCAGSPAPTKPVAAKSSVLAPLHHLLPLLALLTLLHVHLLLLFLCLPNLVCRSWRPWCVPGVLLFQTSDGLAVRDFRGCARALSMCATPTHDGMSGVNLPVQAF
ncbi:hypothetical protein PAPYR_1618 [Paratrimastix pyriformis]|uniref:Uncharacterized protein n=1 Tax=Paratrimastix pyriformis TaxID=342808 RepID=A0ABQ8US05_9EUKA|nr:hypothetical protein PAPYR_1618 [Paratrimastix pyriformis]